MSVAMKARRSVSVYQVRRRRDVAPKIAFQKMPRPTEKWIKENNAKITARLPERVAQQAAHAVSMVYRFRPSARASELLEPLRQASWAERAVDITYRDRLGARTTRRIWPLSIIFLEQRQFVLAWCCLRQGFRKFDPEQIECLTNTDDSFRPNRVPLLRDYVEQLRNGG